MQMNNNVEIYSNDGQVLVVPEWSDSIPTLTDLCDAVRVTHDAAQGAAVKAINRMQTMRNWLIGYYIVEFEQRGQERAEYGAHLLEEIERRVNRKGIEKTMLKVARNFYKFYPQMACNLHLLKSSTLSHQLTSRQDSKNINQLSTDGMILLSHLSFSHIRELLTISDSLARYFYEQECIRCNWSVRELRRQIDTNLYIRAGVSDDREKLLAMQQGSNSVSLSIREPYTFEFLGLNAKDVVTEVDLEDALINHLRDFLLELGKGFCFEARQPRVIIDDEYFYPDLVFYNRLLHCHVIVELKNEAFSHENIGQLNAYVGYYKKHEKKDGDNDPVGILLCTRKGEEMVEYALAGMDNQLFVSTYQLQLPDKELLKQFIVSKSNL